MKKIISLVFIILLSCFVLLSKVPKNDAKVKQAEKLGNEGIELLNQAKLDEAISKFDQAIALDPKPLLYPYEKALAYYQKKEYSEAIKILDSLLTHPEVNDQVYQLLGNSYHFKDKTDKAIETYEAGLEKFPESGRLYMEMGIANASRKKVREVIGYWEKGIELDPSFANNYYYIAKYYSRTGEKLWTILYSEIFLNISDNIPRKEEISKLIFETYNKALFSQEDSTFKISFTSINTSNIDLESKNVNRFEIAYQVTMFKAAKSFLLLKTTNLTLEQISALRTNFIKTWFKDGYNKKFPNIIMDWNKKLLDKGLLTSYNYFIMKMGNEIEFNAWKEKNIKSLRKLVDFLIKNPFKIDKRNKFYRFQYD